VGQQLMCKSLLQLAYQTVKYKLVNHALAR